MTPEFYWLAALGVLIAWQVGVAVWTGRRIAGPDASPQKFWALEGYTRDMYGVRIKAKRGDGWPMFWGILYGVPFAAAWLVSVPALTVGLVFWSVVLLSKRSYLAQVRRARAKVEVLNDRAKGWDEIAEDPEQIPATKDAARATATSLREQARAVRVPPVKK